MPGVTRTLAEETLDPGIAQLQRQFPAQLADQAMANNAARAQAVRGTFEGADQASIDGIEAARDEAADSALSGLSAVRNTSQANPFASLGVALPKQSRAIDIEPVDRLLASQIKMASKRPAVQDALRYVQNLTRGGVQDARQAYDVRKTIDDLMNGRLQGD